LPLASEPAGAVAGRIGVPANGALAGRARRVLLAEDNLVNRKIGVLLLEKLGCRVDIAVNGREAVEFSKGGAYDVILMDCAMPEMDGFTAARQIRLRENGGRRTPIVALTAHAIDGTREQCLEAGMDDYISKPVKPAAIEQALAQWCP